MKKARTLWMALSAVLLVFFTAGCADPAADKPDAEVSEPAATPEPDTEPAAEPAGEVVTYTLSPESSKIGFIGSKVTGSHEGGFESFEGTINVVGGDPTASSVDVTIDTTSLWSDTERLTGHLKSADFFEVETYPTATFTSIRIEEDPEGGYRITGNLDLHGVTKQITFPAAITVSDAGVTANAEFAINRFDFDIAYPGKPDDLIREEVVIQLDLVADGLGGGAMTTGDEMEEQAPAEGEDSA